MSEGMSSNVAALNIGRRISGYYIGGRKPKRCMLSLTFVSLTHFFFRK